MPVTLQRCSDCALRHRNVKLERDCRGYESAPYISNVFSRFCSRRTGEQPASSLTAVQYGGQTQSEVPYKSQPIPVTEALRSGLLLSFLFFFFFSLRQ